MTAKQRLFLFFLWLLNIGVLAVLFIPTGLHEKIPAALHRNNAVTFYLVAGMILARLEMYLYYTLKGE